MILAGKTCAFVGDPYERNRDCSQAFLIRQYAIRYYNILYHAAENNILYHILDAPYLQRP